LAATPPTTLSKARIIEGTFNQYAGAVSGGDAINLQGTYNLYAGDMNSHRLGIGSGGIFNQMGGTASIAFDQPWPMGIATDGTYNLKGGTLNVGFMVNAGAFNFTGGTFSVGSYSGNLENKGGTLAPGYTPSNMNSPTGVTNITGNYSQFREGTYAVEIGGLLAGSDYDVLKVSGTASLKGGLNVSFADLGGGVFMPHLGDTFDILTAELITGRFSFLDLAILGTGLKWQINYLTDAVGTTDVVRLAVVPVPEPEIYAMLIAGLGMLGWIGRRKRMQVAA
jgi:hypothetical protein